MRKFLLAFFTAIAIALSGLQALPAAAALPACSSPALVGSARVGVNLSYTSTCSNSPTSYTYQWKSAATSTGTYTDIAGATQSTYTVQPADVTRYIKVTITPTNVDGTGTAATTTVGLGPVLFASQAFVGSATAGTADGTGSAAGFSAIAGMTSDGTYIYVADQTARTIRRIDSSGVVTTIAGNAAAAAAVVDGYGLGATFHSPNAIVYSQATTSLIIKDASVIREMDLATGLVTTLTLRNTISSISRSGNTVTVAFASPHGLWGAQSVTIAGAGAPFDGVFTLYSTPNASTVTYITPTSGTIAATSPVNATLSSDFGPNRTSSNYWSSYYESFDIAPDGRIYMGRTSAGVTDNAQYVLRFTRISGSIFSYERLFLYASTPCALQMVSNTSMYLGSCYSYNIWTTTDDWVTKTSGTAFGASVNSGFVYDAAAGYVFYEVNRYNTATQTAQAVLSGTTSQMQIWEILGDTLYTSAVGGKQITKYTGAASGQPVAAMAANKTVTFNANSGSGTMSAQIGSGLTALSTNTFTKSGYAFAGWNTAANGSGTAYADNANFGFAWDTTLYAQWTAATYSVTYSVPGGVTAPTQVALAMGSTFTVAAGPSRTGYTFDKWNDGSADYQPGSTYTMGSLAVTLTATWVPDAYVVTFDSQLGSAVAQSSFTTGGSIVLPAAPTRNGYNFMGWFAAASGGSALPSPYTPGVMTPITLYAQWTSSPTYAVSYSVPSGVTAPTQGAVVSGGTFVTAAGPSRAGYTFVKWNDGSTDYNSGATYTMSSSAVTLTAVWTQNSYGVTFDSQSGSAVPASSFTTGGSITLPAAPTRAGYTFDGWFAAASGGTALASPYTPGVLAALTLYAQWTPIAQSSNNQLSNQSHQSSTANDFAPRIISATRPTGVLSASVTIRISGYNLDSVLAHSFSGPAKIIDQSAAILIVSVELQQLGKGSLTLWNTAGSITLLEAFNCVASTFAPSAISVISLGSVSFAADSSKLSSSQAAKLRRAIAAIAGKIEVTITGKTAGTKVTQRDKSLAKARALAVSKAIASAAGGARIVIRTVPSAGAKASSRVAALSVIVGAQR